MSARRASPMAWVPLGLPPWPAPRHAPLRRGLPWSMLPKYSVPSAVRSKSTSTSLHSAPASCRGRRRRRGASPPGKRRIRSSAMSARSLSFDHSRLTGSRIALGVRVLSSMVRGGAGLSPGRPTWLCPRRSASLAVDVGDSLSSCRFPAGGSACASGSASAVGTGGSVPICSGRADEGVLGLTRDTCMRARIALPAWQPPSSAAAALSTAARERVALSRNRRVAPCTRCVWIVPVAACASCRSSAAPTAAPAAARSSASLASPSFVAWGASACCRAGRPRWVGSSVGPTRGACAIAGSCTTASGSAASAPALQLPASFASASFVATWLAGRCKAGRSGSTGGATAAWPLAPSMSGCVTMPDCDCDAPSASFVSAGFVASRACCSWASSQSCPVAATEVPPPGIILARRSSPVCRFSAFRLSRSLSSSALSQSACADIPAISAFFLRLSPTPHHQQRAPRRVTHSQLGGGTCHDSARTEASSPRQIY